MSLVQLLLRWLHSEYFCPHVQEWWWRFFFVFFSFSFSRRQWAAERPGCWCVVASTGVQSGAQISRLTGNLPVVVIKELWAPWGSRSPRRYCVFWALWKSRNISALICVFKGTCWQYSLIYIQYEIHNIYTWTVSAFVSRCSFISVPFVRSTRSCRVCNADLLFLKSPLLKQILTLSLLSPLSLS